MVIFFYKLTVPLEWKDALFRRDEAEEDPLLVRSLKNKKFKKKTWTLKLKKNKPPPPPRRR